LQRKKPLPIAPPASPGLGPRETFLKIFDLIIFPTSKELKEHPPVK
jgi:hypothetical protein